MSMDLDIKSWISQSQNVYENLSQYSAKAFKAGNYKIVMDGAVLSYSPAFRCFQLTSPKPIPAFSTLSSYHQLWEMPDFFNLTEQEQQRVLEIFSNISLTDFAKVLELNLTYSNSSHDKALLTADTLQSLRNVVSKDFVHKEVQIGLMWLSSISRFTFTSSIVEYFVEAESAFHDMFENPDGIFRSRGVEYWLSVCNPVYSHFNVFTSSSDYEMFFKIMAWLIDEGNWHLTLHDALESSAGKSAIEMLNKRGIEQKTNYELFIFQFVREYSSRVDEFFDTTGFEILYLLYDFDKSVQGRFYLPFSVSTKSYKSALKYFISTKFSEQLKYSFIDDRNKHLIVEKLKNNYGEGFGKKGKIFGGIDKCWIKMMIEWDEIAPLHLFRLLYEEED